MKNIALKIVIQYLALSILWVVVSDQLVHLVDLSQRLYLQTSKGVFFVIVSSIVLYFLICRTMHEKYKLAEIIKRIDNMVIMTDTQGSILWVNSAFEKFTGYNLPEILGKTTAFLHGPKTEGNINKLIMESLARKESRNFEVLNYKKNGDEYWVELNISPIYKGDHLDGYVSIQNVITERKLREQKLAAYHSTLRQLSWTNSHGIRKPLSNIMGLVETCKNLDTVEDFKEMHALIEVCTIELDEKIKGFSRVIAKFENEDRELNT